MTAAHSCGTPLVTTRDAVGRARRRCPKCQGVAPARGGPVDNRDVQSQRHLEVPTAPPRRVRSLARDYVHSDVTGFVEAQPRKQVPLNPAIVRPKDYSATKPVPSRATSTRPAPHYRPRTCAPPLGCGEVFAPTSARALWCPSCTPAVRRARGAKAVRT